MYALQCGEFNEIIAWSIDGLSFCINNTLAFEQTILPILFKPAKFESFGRKLSRWGFRKINITGVGPHAAGFAHSQFRRGDYAFCKNMTCSNDASNMGDTEEQVADILASFNKNVPNKDVRLHESSDEKNDFINQLSNTARHGKESAYAMLERSRLTSMTEEANWKKEHRMLPRQQQKELRSDSPGDEMNYTRLHPSLSNHLAASTNSSLFPRTNTDNGPTATEPLPNRDRAMMMVQNMTHQQHHHQQHKDTANSQLLISALRNNMGSNHASDPSMASSAYNSHSGIPASAIREHRSLYRAAENPRMRVNPSFSLMQTLDQRSRLNKRKTNLLIESNPYGRHPFMRSRTIAHNNELELRLAQRMQEFGGGGTDSLEAIRKKRIVNEALAVLEYS